MGAAGIVPLGHVDAAPCGDRADFQFRGNLPLEAVGEAMRLVDAGLLRHADIGGAHQRAAIFDDTGADRTDNAGQGGVVGAGQDAVRRGRLGASLTTIGVILQQLAVEGRVLVFRDIIGEVVGDVGRGLPTDGDAATDAVIIAPAGLARHRVLRGRALILLHCVNFDGEVVELRQIDVRSAIISAKIAEAGFDAAAELAARCLGDDREGAAFRVAAEQRALRTLQHFDALGIEQRSVQTVLTAEIDAVNIDADALLACGLIGVERNDAANTDGQRGLARFEGGDAERRNAAIGKIEQALDVTVLDHLRIDDVDRNRRLLQIGFALGRGHHDFLQARTRIGLGCIAGCGRGLRGKRRAQREHGNAAQQSRDGAVSRNHGECPFASSVDGRAIRSVARQ